jgi:alanyl-tRNA synthetase
MFWLKLWAIISEIIDKQKFIKEAILGEEESFNETLDRGLVLFNEEVEKMKKSFVGRITIRRTILR